MSYDSFDCAWKLGNRYELEKSNIFHVIAHDSTLHN